MTCRDIETRLSAYLEGDMPSSEKEEVERHLASCRSCSSALADLKKTLELVRNVPEVEPPPWLKTKIMTQVREEAEAKRGIIHRLFYPLRVKVPVQAFAVLLVAVLAVYVYRATGPEPSFMKRPAPEVHKAEIVKPPPPEVREAKAPGAVKAPEKVDAAIPAPPSKTTPEPSRKEAVLKDSAAPASAATAAPSAAPSVAQDEVGKGIGGAKQDVSAGMEDKLRMAAKEKEQPLNRAEAESRRGRKAELAKSAPTLGTARAERPLPPSPAPPFTVGLVAKDPAGAAREVESLFARLGGREVKRLSEGEKETVGGLISPEKLKEFLENLESIGTVRQKPRSVEGREEKVLLNVEIVRTP